jgi:hypothetical protein
MKTIIGKALCVAMLAVPVVAMSAEDSKGCDSVNWGEEVLTKFPNAQKGCHGVMKKENGEVYAHYVAEVVQADANSVTVNLLDRSNKPISEVRFEPNEVKTVKVGGKQTDYSKLTKGTKLDLWIQHNRWGLYSDPASTPMKIVSRRDL